MERGDLRVRRRKEGDLRDVEEVVVLVVVAESATSSSSGSMENMVASGYKARTKATTQIGHGDAGAAV